MFGGKYLEMLYIQALNIARQAYISAKSSDRVKRALRHPVRASEDMFCHKGKIFDKRDDSNRWRGPATVIGQDGKIVFVRHGSVVVCRCVKFKDSFVTNETSYSIASNSNRDVKINSNRDPTSSDNVKGSSIDIDSDSESEFKFENDIDSEVILKQEIQDQSNEVNNE